MFHLEAKKLFLDFPALQFTSRAKHLVNIVSCMLLNVVIVEHSGGRSNTADMKNSIQLLLYKVDIWSDTFGDEK